MNLNIVQFMSTNHIVDEIKFMILKNANCQHEIFKSIIMLNEIFFFKFSFSIFVIEYNIHIKKSNENIQ